MSFAIVIEACSLPPARYTSTCGVRESAADLKASVREGFRSTGQLEHCSSISRHFFCPFPFCWPSELDPLPPVAFVGLSRMKNDSHFKMEEKGETRRKWHRNRSCKSVFSIAHTIPNFGFVSLCPADADRDAHTSDLINI